VFAAGHRQRAEVEVVHQLRAFAHQLMLIGAAADDGFEFAEVWRDQGCPTVDREILALGVDLLQYLMPSSNSSTYAPNANASVANGSSKSIRSSRW
jgi:hypothetical protein